MSQVLYRKYRPKTFREVEGQEHVVKTLQGALSLGRVSHAYLFAGPRGSGKTTVARLLSNALNCDHVHGLIASKSLKPDDADSCLKCPTCKAEIFDVIELDAASNRGIDEIRNIKEAVRSAPLQGKYKIFIIDEVHMLTKDAFNALLKTLEEPPSHVIFILATTEPYKVLPTVLSRVQRFDFKRLTVGQIVNKLKKIIKIEKIKVPDEVLSLVSLNADGSLRDAESNLAKLISFVGSEVKLADAQNLLGIIPFNLHEEFTNYLADRKSEDGVSFVNRIYESGVDLSNFTDSFLEYLRKMMVLKSSSSVEMVLAAELTPEHMGILKEQANRFTIRNLANFISIFIKAKDNLKSSPVPQLPLELAFLDALDKID
jgi:DNA polymerase-3 subunit gamma/tau